MKLRKFLMAPDGNAGGSGDNSTNNANPPAAGGTTPAAQPAGITEEALKAAIEKARLEERNKLRADLEAKQKSVDENAAKLAEMQKTVDTLNATMDSLKTAKTSDGTVDVSKLLSEITEKVSTPYSKELQDLKQQLNTLQLERLKGQLIQEAGGPSSLVMELIGGSSEAEIRASIEKSKSAYAALEAKIKAALGTSGNNSNRNANADTTNNPPDVNGAAGGSGAGGSGAGRGADGSLIANVKAMTPEEYAANRAKLMAEHKKRYPGNHNVFVSS
jgi:hypothetical protein